MMQYGATLQSLLETNTAVYEFLRTKYFRAVSLADVAKRVAETEIPHSLTAAIDALDLDFDQTNTPHNPLREWTDSYKKLDAMYSDEIKVQVTALLAVCPQLKVTVQGSASVCYDLYRQLKHCRFCGSLTTFYYPFCCICFLPFAPEDMHETRKVITTAGTVSVYADHFTNTLAGLTPLNVFGTDRFTEYKYTSIVPLHVLGTLLDPRHMYYIVQQAIVMRDAYWMGRPVPDMGVEYQRMRILVERIRLFPDVLMPWYMCIPAQITTSDEGVRDDKRIIGGKGYDLADAPMEEAKGAYYFNDFPDVAQALLDLDGMAKAINAVDETGLADVFMENGRLKTGLDSVKDTIASSSLTRFNNVLALANGQINAAICLRMPKTHRLYRKRFTLRAPEITKINPRELLKASRVNRALGLKVEDIMNSFSRSPENLYSLMLGGDELFVYAMMMAFRTYRAVHAECMSLARTQYAVKQPTQDTAKYIEYLRTFEVYPDKCSVFNIMGGYYTIICDALNSKGIISPFKFVPSTVAALTHSLILTFEINTDGVVTVPNTHNPEIAANLIHNKTAFILYDSTNNVTKVPLTNSAMGIECIVVVSCEYEHSMEYMYKLVTRVSAVRQQLGVKHQIYEYTDLFPFYAICLPYQHFWEYTGVCHFTKLPVQLPVHTDLIKYVTSLQTITSSADTVNPLRRTTVRNLSHASPGEYNVRVSGALNFARENIATIYDGLQLVFYNLTGKSLASSDPTAFVSSTLWDVVF